MKKASRWSRHTRKETKAILVTNWTMTQATNRCTTFLCHHANYFEKLHGLSMLRLCELRPFTYKLLLRWDRLKNLECYLLRSHLLLFLHMALFSAFQKWLVFRFVNSADSVSKRRSKFVKIFSVRQTGEIFICRKHGQPQWNILKNTFLEFKIGSLFEICKGSGNKQSTFDNQGEVKKLL